MPRGFGRTFTFDKDDINYMIRDRLEIRAHENRRKLWWANGFWGDVADKPWAVEFAWRAALCDAGKELDMQYGLFHELCLRKEANGQNTTVRAGAKVLKEMGMIGDYYWAFDAEDIITTVLTRGPIVMGSDWYAAMNYPMASGLLKVEGGKVAEHAYVVNGVDMDREVVRIKNCWGRSWGKNGYGFLSFYGLDKLIWENGDACYTILSKEKFELEEKGSRLLRLGEKHWSADPERNRNPSNEMASVA